VENPVLEITCLDPESGLVMSDFERTEDPIDHSCVPRYNRLDPPSDREDFLSGYDFGRDRLIGVESGLGPVFDRDVQMLGGFRTKIFGMPQNAKRGSIRARSSIFLGWTQPTKQGRFAGLGLSRTVSTNCRSGFTEW
jgi:hypothetical protein